MNKEDWKAFLGWLNTASNQELETKLLRIEATSALFGEDGPRADARAMIRAIQIELDARRAVR